MMIFSQLETQNLPRHQEKADCCMSTFPNLLISEAYLLRSRHRHVLSLLQITFLLPIPLDPRETAILQRKQELLGQISNQVHRINVS